MLGEPPARLLAEVAEALLRASTDDLDWFAWRLCGLPFDFEIRQQLRRAVEARPSVSCVTWARRKPDHR